MNLDIANMVLNIEQQSSKDLIDILSALLTPCVAAITGYIAYQQWQTNERKRKQDLFEKRYNNLYMPILKCSENITKIKDLALSDNEKNKKIEDEINKFWNKYNKYKFLITQYDAEILQNNYNHMLKIIKEHKYKDVNFKTDKASILSVMKLLYFFSIMEKILSKYLRIENDSLLTKFISFIKGRRQKAESFNSRNNKEGEDDL